MERLLSRVYPVFNYINIITLNKYPNPFLSMPLTVKCIILAVYIILITLFNRLLCFDIIYFIFSFTFLTYVIANCKLYIRQYIHVVPSGLVVRIENNPRDLGLLSK